MMSPPVRRAMLMWLVLSHWLMGRWAGTVWADEAAKASKPSPPSLHASLTAAYEAASKDNALILVVFGAGWCGPCRALNEQTLSSRDFLDKGGPLHVVKVDVDGPDKLAQRFGVRSVPHLAILTAEGKIVSRRVGFLRADELLAWIGEARRRAAAGAWEGTAPGREVAVLLKKLSGRKPDSEAMKQLTAMLGNADPAERTQAAKALLAQREAAVPFLLAGVSDAYLGARIGAAEVLRKMAPAAPPFDPWASPEDRKKGAARLSEWWSKTQSLPPAGPPEPLDIAAERCIETALAGVLSDDPVRRTEGMSALTRLGAAALPKVREQLRRCERRNDQKAVWLLEDVRWAILIPDDVEARSRGTRHDLARGASQERQEAALRLGRVGGPAIAALAELIDDADPLVKEAALHALAAVNGTDVLEPMAALLKSGDSNLRMTAAQLLGSTAQREAAPYLIAAVSDPDEIVACTAIAALEEIKAVDQRDVLVRCLADTRWRVRAAAAEAIGKLKLPDTTKELEDLLDDPDGFVAKSALEALQALQATPSPAKLSAVAKRLPTLAGPAAGILAKENTKTNLEHVERIYNQAAPEGRAAILDALARSSGNAGGKDAHWKPLLSTVLAEADPSLREKAADVLTNRSPELAAEMIGQLLEDADPRVRSAAADCVIGIASYHYGLSRSGDGVYYGALAPTVGPKRRGPLPQIGPKTAAQTAKVREQHKAWHKALVEHAGDNPDVRVVLAICATGDGKSDWPLLAKLAERPNLEGELQRMRGERSAFALMLARLPWPEGQPILERVCRAPALYGLVVSEIKNAPTEVRAYVTNPDRLLAAMEHAEKSALRPMMEALLLSPAEGMVSLPVEGKESDRAVGLLLQAKRPEMRTLAIHALGFRSDEKSLRTIEQACKDPDPWVRRAAAEGLARRVKDGARLHGLLAPLLWDSHPEVVRTAVAGLLDPGITARVSLERMSNYLRAEALWVRNQFAEYRTNRLMMRVREPGNRPLRVSPERPDFLPKLLEHMSAAGTPGKDEGAEEERREKLAVLALLLAQYGEFGGVDKMAEAWQPGGRSDLDDLLLIGIALSRDTRYVGLLRRIAASRNSDSELREVLAGLRGMKGAEARRLRREINRRLMDLSE